MTPQEELLELADRFVKNETGLATFYQACGAKNPGRIDTWEILAAQEQRHASIFRDIRTAISTRRTSGARDGSVPGRWSSSSARS